MREVRLSGEQEDPAPRKNTPRQTREGIPASPTPRRREPRNISHLSGRRSWGRVSLAAASCEPRGAPPARQREARPPARPCGSGRGSGGGTLRPRRAPPTPGAAAAGGRGFSGTHGTAERRPEHTGRPGGHPLRGELPPGSSRGGAAATRRLARLDRGPARVRPPPGGQAGAAEAPGPRPRLGPPGPRAAAAGDSPRAPPAAPPAPGDTRAAVRPPGLAPGPPPPGIVPPPPPSSTPPPARVSVRPAGRPARPPAAMNM